MMKTATHITAKISLFCVGIMLLVACAHDPYSVVVIDANAVKSSTSNSRYVVKKGDTLYSIAFRYGTTVYALARRNGLSEPYTIFTGQPLSVATSVQAQPKKRLLAKVKPTPTKPAVAKPPKVSTAPRQSIQAKGITAKWILPSNAALGKGFSQGKVVHKGLDFNAPKGSPVLSSRAGKVVYAGDGLKAYGLLIIIKHDQHYLSAYAYNQRLFVKEGDSVRQGQKIAAVGNKGDQSLLHFEIRKDGKPINPKLVLPKTQ